MKSGRSNDLSSMRVERGATGGLVLEHGRLRDATRVVAGHNGLSRAIDHPRVQKTGLALAGHTHGVVPSRVQIFGETEMTFLEGLEPDVLQARLRTVLDLGLAMVIVTRNAEPMEALVQLADQTETPLVVSSYRSSRTIQAVHSALDELLAPKVTKHGVLIDIHGIGTLLLGPSGIGKSECALFLVERGHRLVADDQVELTRLPSNQIVGRAPTLLRNHLELRGIGIINVRDLFGANAVRTDKSLQLVVELCPWDEGEPFDRLGLDDATQEVLGVPIPMLRIPVRSGRNMAVILEVAARNHILKQSGTHAAQAFVTTISGRFEGPT